MPQNKKQEFIYTIMMVIAMVYALICYNIVLETGSMKNFVFAAALAELPIMGVIAFVLDTWIAGPIAKKITFRLFQPGEDKQIFIILSISVLSVWMMCPMMSLAATLLLKGGFQSEMISVWIETTILNFPMALLWQLFAAGPLVRAAFGRLYPQKNREISHSI